MVLQLKINSSSEILLSRTSSHRPESNLLPFQKRMFRVVGKRYALTELILLAALVFVCLLPIHAHACPLFQQQPLNHGPLQPTVINQSSAGNANSANDDLNNESLSNGSSTGGWGQSSPSNSQGFPADFNAINRGGNSQPQLPAALPSPNQPLSQTTGPGLIKNATQWNSQTPVGELSGTQQFPSAQQLPFPPASSTLNSDSPLSTSRPTSVLQSEAEHANHNPAFHVDNENQIDRASRTDGTGISLAPIQNPILPPLKAESQSSGQAGESMQVEMQPIQSQSNLGQANSNFVPTAEGQTTAYENATSEPQLTATTSSILRSPASGQDQMNSANERQVAPANGGGNNSMRQLLEQDTNRNSIAQEQSPTQLWKDSAFSSSGIPTAAPIQEPNPLQMSSRLPGAMNRANQLNNGLGNGGATNNSASIFEQPNAFQASNQQSAEQSPVVPGGRGDFAIGNPLLPQDQSSPLNGSYRSAQSNAAENMEKQRVVGELNPRVSVQMPTPKNSGAFASRQDTRKVPAEPAENLANSAGNQPTNAPFKPTAGNGADSTELTDSNAKEYQLVWNLVFFVSIGFNVLLAYLLTETRNNYRDLADELQDRFFREAG